MQHEIITNRMLKLLHVLLGVVKLLCREFLAMLVQEVTVWLCKDASQDGTFFWMLLVLVQEPIESMLLKTGPS